MKGQDSNAADLKDTAQNRALFGEAVFYWRDLHSGPNGATQDIIWCDSQVGLYKKLVLDENRLAGAVLVGDTLDAPWYLELIRSGADVSSLRDSIVFGKAILERQAA
jgi:NAD(P)H-nitrite reductase large subunit